MAGATLPDKTNLCENCYDLAAKTHRRDAERAENFKNEMDARRSTMRWSDSLRPLPLRTLRRCGDMPFLQWTLL